MKIKNCKNEKIDFETLVPLKLKKVKQFWNKKKTALSLLYYFKKLVAT